MKVIVGLGNPGKKYEGTRHNIGADLVREFAGKHSFPIHAKRYSSFVGEGSWSDEPLVILLPQTFMNLSGRAVREAIDDLRFFPQQMMVVHDDIDFPLGRIKWDQDAGSAGHRGVQSIIDELGTQDFFRLRLGVGKPSSKEEVEDYVLTHFSEDEAKTVLEVRSQGLPQIETWLSKETL